MARGRKHLRAAAIVPADLVEAYEAMIDQEDGAIASRRLADVDAGCSDIGRRTVRIHVRFNEP